MGLVVNGCIPLFYNYVGCRYFIIMLVADLMDSVLCCWLLFLALFVEGAGGLVIKFKYGLKWMSWFVFESLFSLVFSAVCLYLLCRFCAFA